jgi:SpoIID/LytB domain protein
MLRSARSASISIGAAVLLVATVVGAPTAAADPTTTNVPIVHIDGRGHGHGVGMSQWGAFTLADQGSSAADIIGTFYPGTELGQAGGEVIVPLQTADRVRVQFPSGGEVRASRSGEQPAGFPVQVAPGGTVELVRTGAGHQVVGGVAPLSTHATSYRASPSDCVLLVICEPDDGGSPPPTTTTTAPPSTTPSGGGGGGGGTGGGGGGGTPPPTTGAGPTTAAPPPPPTAASPLWAVPAGGGPLHAVGRGRSYRGLFEFGGGRLRNHVDVEDYVRGMAEVPGSWPAAAVQAQAIAARTFALRAMAAGGEICDTESCQVYNGVSAESAGQSAAVDATRGTVVRYGGGYASTFYSASGGGHTATVAEGFGSAGDVPYLQARTYPTANPKPYSLDLALTDVAARLGYGGTIEDIRIDEKGPSGRALRMTIVGDAGAVAVDPQDFRRRLGLRSTLFEVTTSEAEKPPPPPTPGEDPGVVGTSVAPVDLGRIQTITPARSDHRLSRQALAPVSPAAAAPLPLPLVALAVLLIGCTLVSGLAQVGNRRRLHPLFALTAVAVDVSGDYVRARIRRGGRAIVTMARWRIPRR